ncbi:Uncharacterised protein [Leminorella richardii]|uniref:DUF2531 family protein n=1 Tax=Leminorella richardii TaxID=158841 RepID=A0A2X4XE01_9GAMM|nr:hypothetical protein [Leminorella richardii]SQI34864.1 Uncharacterised protein [Leminorella richardii]
MTMGRFTYRIAPLFLLCLPFLGQSERQDPFQVEESQRCQAQVKKEANALLTWRLAGVIRSGETELGWVQVPEGAWLALNGRAPLPLTYWQLRRVADGTAQFLADPSLRSRCRPNALIEIILGK